MVWSDSTFVIGYNRTFLNATEVIVQHLYTLQQWGYYRLI